MKTQYWPPRARLPLSLCMIGPIEHSPVWTWCSCDHTSLVQRCKQPEDVTAFSFINLFISAHHVSGDKFAHTQEHFLTVYTAFGTMHCEPYGSHVKILLIIIYHYSALYQKLYIQSKSAPEDGRICRPKHVGMI